MLQVILSGGIFHDFSATSQLLADYAEHLQMASIIVEHPDEAFALIQAGGVSLLTVNARCIGRWRVKNMILTVTRGDMR